jgi:hypothetical protein
MSERYPAISQLIAENRIPEFDALYVRDTKQRKLKARLTINSWT